MIRQIVAMTLKELKVLLLDREALALLFAMPTFFILVMSFALEGVFEAGSKNRPIEVIVVHRDGGPIAEGILLDLKRLEGLIPIETLGGAPVTAEKAEACIRNGDYPLALVFQEGFSDHLLERVEDPQQMKPTVTLISDPATNAQILASVRGVLRSVIERHTLTATLPARIKAKIAERGAQLPFGGGTFMRRIERQVDEALADSSTVGTGDGLVDFINASPRGFRAERRPTATEQNVPGYTIFGVFFIVLTLASSFIQEKGEGTFQRILAAPMSKAALLIGKLLPYYLVNLIQVGLMFLVGVVVFGMSLGDLSALTVVSLALAAAANGLGLLVATLGKTEPQVNGLAVLFAITLAALGGIMVPVFVMPGLMKALSLFTPHAWALAGYHDVIIRGLGVRAVLPEAGILLGFAAFFFAIALWRFRFE